MYLPFYKYQGTGNDFIIIDDRRGVLGTYTTKLVQQLCDRRLGIGADGLIVIKVHPRYDFEMVYHNADGSQSLCGNGCRCAVHLAQQLAIIDRKAYFLTTDGPHQAYVRDGLIHLMLKDVTEVQTFQGGYLLHTGSPHYVQQITDWRDLDVYHEGNKIRNSPPFYKEGINVNFVHLEKNNQIFVRTYERGVEDETLSCGTGVAAAALIAATKGYTSPIAIHTRGGMLQVSFFQNQPRHFQNICLIGPAKMVFQGEINRHRIVGKSSYKNR
jgi:diaminopimelate epimerase